MSDALNNSLAENLTFREVKVGAKRFITCGISPIRLAAMRKAKSANEDSQIATMKDGVEYVRNSCGKLVRLEDFDPETMEQFVLTRHTHMTQEQLQQLRDSVERDVPPDEDCPASTPAQLERFKKFGMERNKRRAAMERARAEKLKAEG